MTDKMASETALELIQDMFCDGCQFSDDGCIDCIWYLVIESLGKQIPKKPILKPDDDCCVYHHWACPACGYNYGHAKVISAIYNSNITYCPICSQAIDWESDTE